MAKGIGTAAYLMTGAALACFGTVGAIREGRVDLKKYNLGDIILVDELLMVTWPLWIGYGACRAVCRTVKKRNNNPETKEPVEEET